MIQKPNSRKCSSTHHYVALSR
uniref:Uncharacterized protein n=1 Tax=Arundo donax TaxID=35708 RepID=A0A0A9G1W5_ARUDO